VSLSVDTGFAAITSGTSDLVPGDIDDEVLDIFVGRPCMEVPEPALALLQLAALLGLAGMRSLPRLGLSVRIEGEVNR